MATALIVIVMLANAAWFGAALYYFALRPHGSAAVLVPREARNSPLFETVAASLRFLGGMNGALAVFAVAIVVSVVATDDVFAGTTEQCSAERGQRKRSRHHPRSCRCTRRRRAITPEREGNTHDE